MNLKVFLIMKQNNILIKNIYYMLAYVYCDLNKKQYACLAVENFEDIEDLLTSILIKGVNYQLKRDYILIIKKKKIYCL